MVECKVLEFTYDGIYRGGIYRSPKFQPFRDERLQHFLVLEKFLMNIHFLIPFFNIVNQCALYVWAFFCSS